MYAQDSIEMLKTSGIDFEMHEVGVGCRWFVHCLWRRLIILVVFCFGRDSQRMCYI